MQTNKITPDQFSITHRNEKLVKFPYARLTDRQKSGTLNSFQRHELSDAQKNKLKNDLRRLGDV